MTLLAGAQAPECYEAAIVNSIDDPAPLDFTTVSAVLLRVVRAGSDSVVWPATIITQTASVLVVQHVFDVADVDRPGGYQILAEMTVPGGIRRAGPAVLRVSAS